MLNKIGMFTFLEAIGATWLIAHYVPPVATLLGSLKIPVMVWSIELPILYVVPGVAFALIARIIRLHDSISDVFRIRQTFDLYRVLLPLAGAVNLAISPASRDRLRAVRKKAMQRTFYAFASFEDPKISKALVLSSIDVWTWYWILIEFLGVLVVTSGILLCYGAFVPAAYTLLAILVLSSLACTAFTVCGSKADHQIEEIVGDSGRVDTLKREFASLLNGDGE